MFSLHETQRRRWCRAAFFVLCVAPTVATLAFVAAKRWPGRDGRWSAASSARLLTPVSIVGGSELRPGVVECTAATLLDRTAPGPLAELAAISSQFTSQGRALRVQRVELSQQRLPQLAAVLHQWLADESLVGEALVDELVVTQDAVAPPEDQPAPDAVETDANESEQPAGHALDDPGPRGGPAGAAVVTLRSVRIRLSREDGRRRLVVRAVVDDGVGSGDAAEDAATQQSAPLSFTVQYDPAAESPERRLHVAIEAPTMLPFESLAGHWSYQLHSGRPGSLSFDGAIHQLDPAALLPADSPHEIHGVAELPRLQATWTPSGGVRIDSGDVEMTQVQVSPSFARGALVLWCVPMEGAWSEISEGRPELISLSRLSFRFVWSPARELTVSGLCGEGSEPTRISRIVMQGGQRVPINLAVLATRNGEPWLLEPQYERIPQATWRQFLAPAASEPAPAEPE